MLITAYNIYSSKKRIIETYIDNAKEGYLEKIYSINNRFYSSFYEHVVFSTVADAYEGFLELDCRNNFLYENIENLNPQRGGRFFKIMAVYHTIKILRKKRNELNSGEMEEVLFKVFEFNDTEKRLYELLYTCACEFEQQFELLFSKSFARYVFSKNVDNPFVIAFIENFCYNSYKSFLESFSKYISLNRRILIGFNS